MEEKKQYHKPTPGIPEALHPEIGNGSAVEKDSHAFLLRTPDPSKRLDAFLSFPEAMSSESEVVVNPEEATLRTSAEVPQENKPIEITSSSSEDQPEAPILSEKDISEMKESDINTEGEQPKSNKAPKKKTVRKSNAKTETETTPSSAPVEEKPQKAGKRLRKAARSINKQEELTKEEKPLEKPLPEPTLSPFTAWIKNLAGSEYVHPYEDDFALDQGSGGIKQGISETFADLLAAQGYKDEARKMYLRLMEKYPEKSSFFAAKIEALQ